MVDETAALINRALQRLGIQVVRTQQARIPASFHAIFRAQLAQLEKEPRGFRIVEGERFDAGDHPDSFVDYQCAFAAAQIARLEPSAVLDIGSYRHFILGLLAHYRVTTVDVRDRKPISKNETVLTADAKALPLPEDTFDAVVTLCALEHFGLGRYGDAFDPEGDRRALSEMVRVLKPGGRLIVTTTVTRGEPQCVHNAHRIYSQAMLGAMRGRLSGLCQPTYVLDIPGGHGKAPLGPDYATAGSVEDFNGLRHLKETEPQFFQHGIVLYSGREVVPFGADLFAVPLSMWWAFNKRAA